jgi:hypothetical protein
MKCAIKIYAQLPGKKVNLPAGNHIVYASRFIDVQVAFAP